MTFAKCGFVSRLPAQFPVFHGVLGHVVVVGRDMRFVHFDNIFMEEECGAFDAVSLLLRNGHKHIGMLSGSHH